MPPAKASIVVELSSDENRLLRGMQKVLDKEREVNKAREKGGETAQKVGKNQEDMLDKNSNSLEKFGRRIVKLGLQWVTVSSAVTAVRAGLQGMRQEMADAISGVERLADARRKLRQVAGGDPEENARLNRIGDAIASSGETTLGRARARELVFSAKSGGFLPDVAQIARQNPIIRAESQALVASKGATLFPGLTPLKAIAGVFAAAEESPEAFQQIAQAFPRAAEGTAAAGSTPAETMALLGFLTKKFATPEATADRLKQFGIALSLDPRTAGLGVMQGTRVLENMSESERSKFLGRRAETITAFRNISQNREGITAFEAATGEAIRTGGTEQGPVRRARAAATLGFEGKLLQGRMELAKETALEEMSLETFMAERGFESETAVKREIRKSRDRGESAFARAITTKPGAQLGGDVAGTPGAAVGAFGARSALAGTGPVLIIEAFRTLFGASEKLDSAADKIGDAGNQTHQMREITRPQE